MVGNAMGLLPVPGARQVGELATGAFGQMVIAGYDKLTGTAYDEIARQAARRMSEHGRSLDETHRMLADNRVAVERLAEQMLATAVLNKGLLDEHDMNGRLFTTGIPPTIKPFAEMSPQEYSDFLDWARRKGGSGDLFDRFSGTFRRTSEVDDYLGLQIPGGGK